MLNWTGEATAAHLIAYEFNAPTNWGHEIWVNGYRIGEAKGTRNNETFCAGYDGLDPLTWDFSPSVLVQGENVIEIRIDPAYTTDQSWGLSRIPT